MNSTPSFLQTITFLTLLILLPYTVEPLPKILKNLLSESILFKFFVICSLLIVYIQPENKCQWTLVVCAPVLILLILQILRNMQENYGYSKVSSLQPTECKENYSNEEKETDMKQADNMVDSIIQSINSAEQKAALTATGMSETQIQERITQSIDALNDYKQSLRDKVNEKFTAFQLLQEKESNLMQINKEIEGIIQKITAIPISMMTGMQ